MRKDKKKERKEVGSESRYALARATLEKIAGGSLTQYKSAEEETKRREKELDLKVIGERLTELINGKSQPTSPTGNVAPAPKGTEEKALERKNEIVKEIEPSVETVDYQATVKVIKAVASIAISMLDGLELEEQRNKGAKV